MKKCNNCNIMVGGDYINCPLCQHKLSGESSENNWPPLGKFKTQAYFFKIQLFIILMLIIVALLLDFRLGINNGKHFSLIILMWGTVVEFMLHDFLKKRVVVAKIVTVTMVCLSFLLAGTGWYYNFLSPIADYVIPSLIMAALVTNFIFSISEKSGNALIYLLANIVIGVIPYIILSIIDYENMLLWTISLMIIIAALLGILIFRGRIVLSELQKRMNM